MIKAIRFYFSPIICNVTKRTISFEIRTVRRIHSFNRKTEKHENRYDEYDYSKIHNCQINSFQAINLQQNYDNK